MTIRKTILCSIVPALFLLGVSLPSHSASVCKGLSVDACGENASCGWVNSYTRKDGREVSGFCRVSSKGKSKAVSQKALEAKTQEKKS